MYVQAPVVTDRLVLGRGDRRGVLAQHEPTLSADRHGVALDRREGPLGGRASALVWQGVNIPGSVPPKLTSTVTQKSIHAPMARRLAANPPHLLIIPVAHPPPFAVASDFRRSHAVYSLSTIAAVFALT